MANTLVKIRQLEQSTSPSSILYTNGSNVPIYFAPSTGADRILFWDNSASSIAWLDYGAGLTISGTTLTANVQSVNSQTGAVVLTTTNIAEGTNLYFTDERVDDRVSSLLQAGTNITLNYDDTANTLTISATAGAGGITTVQEEGSNLTNRSTINFIGGGITATDNSGSGRTDITLDATLNALAAYNTDGILTQTAADTFVGRTLTAPAAGFTITNPAGVAGNPTFVLANDLAALEGLASTGIAVRTASDTWAQRTITGTTDRISITDGNGVSGNPTIDIASGYVGQASITTLGTITTGTWNGTTVGPTFGGTGQTTVTTGDLLYGSASNVWSKRAIGSTGNFLRVSGGLPTWATAASTDLSDTANIALLDATQTFSGTNTFSNNVVLNGTPSAGNHAITVDYLNNALANQQRAAVRVATTAAGTLATSFENGDTIDGITLVTGDRILIKDQASQAENGIYTVNASGAPTRALDMNTAAEVDGTFVIVQDGSTNLGTFWYTVSEVTTLGTDAIVFTRIDKATDITAGTGLSFSGLTLNVGTASSSRIVVNANDIDLATTGVSASTYGSATDIPTITVDAYGRITSASANPLEFTVAVLDTNPGFTFASTGSGSFVGMNIVSGSGANVDIDAAGSAIRISHGAVSAASNLDTSAAQVIDTLTFDSFGHVTGVTTRNLTISDLGGSGDTTIAYLEGSTATTVDLDTGTSVKDRNGTDFAFTLPTNIDNFEVYRNGILQNRSGTITTRDYQVNTGTNEITFVTALTSDEIVIFKKR